MLAGSTQGNEIVSVPDPGVGVSIGHGGSSNDGWPTRRFFRDGVACWAYYSDAHTSVVPGGVGLPLGTIS